jgi:hypothetical protein
MEKSPEIIILRERAADVGRVRAVLLEWGYGESVIRDLLGGTPPSSGPATLFDELECCSLGRHDAH